jgi:hypothetical protein
MIIINWQFIASIPSEPTGVLDYITFVYLWIYVAQFLVIIITLLLLRKHIIIGTKNVPNIILLCFAGIIHAWSAFVSNEQFESFRAINYYNCSLFIFIGQYLFGLQIWFLCIYYRVITYGFIFETRQGMTEKKKLYWKVGLGLLLSLPGLVLCLTGLYMHGSMFYPEIASCNLQVFWRVLIVSWIILGILMLIILALIFIPRISNKFFQEGPALKQIILLGFVIMLINGLLSFGEWISFPWGRSLYTFCITILYIFTVYRLCLFRIYKALRKDELYDTTFHNYIYPKVDLKKIRNINEIKQNSLAWANFLDFCRHKELCPKTVCDIYFTRGKSPRTEFIVSCIVSIDRFCLYYESNTKISNKQHYKMIIDTYCDEGMPGYLYLQEMYTPRKSSLEGVDRNSLRDLYNILLTVLSTSFVTDYLNDGFKEYFEEELRKSAFLDNMQSEQLIDKNGYKSLQSTYAFQSDIDIDIEKGLEMSTDIVRKSIEQIGNQIRKSSSSPIVKGK